MPRFRAWLQRHRLSAFFVLAFAISWCSWPLYAAGLMTQFEFLPIGPLAAALVIIGLAEGRAGFRVWGRRLVRWRVGWAWYAVALLLPALMALLAGFANVALGAPAPGLAGVTWSGLLAVFAVRLVNPLAAPWVRSLVSAVMPCPCSRPAGRRCGPRRSSASWCPSGTFRWSCSGGSA